MQYSLHIEKPKDFVRLDAQGYADLKAIRRLLAKVATTCRDRGICLALLDVREMYADPRPMEEYDSEVCALVKCFHELGIKSTHRLAVLHRYNSTERGELFSVCATEQGFDARAFDDYEEAITWLGGSEHGLLTHVNQDGRTVHN